MDLREACRSSIAQVGGDIEDALVYLDAGAAEALHFIGGLAAFLPFRPRSVCSLEDPSPLDSRVLWIPTSEGPAHKILVITARLLSDAHRYILRCLRMHTSITTCTILTSISEEAHSAHPDTPLGPDAFHEYRILLQQDFQVLEAPVMTKQVLDGDDEHSVAFNGDNEKTVADIDTSPSDTREADKNSPIFSISIKHFPMLICPITAKTFVFPSKGAVAEALYSDKNKGSLSPLLPGFDLTESVHGEDYIPPGAPLLASFLQHISWQLDLKLDVFTLGPFAHLVGKIFTEFSGLPDISGRAKRSAGLLLIDRSLDLVTPTCHGDSLIDRFFCSLLRNYDGTSQATGSPSVIVNHPPLDLRVPVLVEKSTDMYDKEIFHSICKLVDLLVNLTAQTTSNSPPMQLPTRQEDVRNIVGSFGERTDWMHFMGDSLFDSMDNLQTERLDFLFERKTKESALMIRKWLQEALRKEKMSAPGRGKIGAVKADELHSLWELLTGSSDCTFRHTGLIQIARATELVLDSNVTSRWEAFASAEKILMLNASDSSQNVAYQIHDLVHKSLNQGNKKTGFGARTQSQDASLLSLHDVLTLAIIGFALAGDNFGSATGSPFSWEEQCELKEAVVNAILDGSSNDVLVFLADLEDSLKSYWQRQVTNSSEEKTALHHEDDVKEGEGDNHVMFDEEWESWGDVDVMAEEREEEILDGSGTYDVLQLKLELRDRVEEVFKVLHRAADAGRYLSVRNKFWDAEEKNSSSSSSALLRSLIYKILSRVSSRTEISGIQHHSSTVGRFLKSGLGRFGLTQAKPKLSDYKVLLVFIIGGINAVEVREVKEAQSLFQATEGMDIILGGTTFLTPDDMHNLLFSMV